MFNIDRDNSARSVSWVVESSLPLGYQVVLKDNIFDPSVDLLTTFGNQGEGARRLLFLDDALSDEVEQEIEAHFEAKGVEVRIVKIHCSEEGKDLDTLLFILGEMENYGISRRGDPVIVMGGGVIMDVVAFAASLYRRGVPYIKVPTTLLGLVDASVGIKTSINHFTRRNRLGSYHCPVAAILDAKYLVTLPGDEMAYGLAEILKIAIIKDGNLFELMEQNSERLMDPAFYREEGGLKVMELAVSGMLEELADNLHEIDLERVVDFGHSISPIPEMRSLDDDAVESLAHGQAVILDCLIFSTLSWQQGKLGRADLERIISLVDRCGLDLTHPYFERIDYLWESMLDTIKHRDGSQNLPVPTSIGEATFYNDLSIDELQRAVDAYQGILKEVGHGE